MKEPPLVTANTVLSILAVDYPVDKVSCYVSDDGAAMLTFDALAETSEFARKWVPFCKKYNIEPRAPEWYFAQKIDYLKDKIQTSFVKDRRAMKVYLAYMHVGFVSSCSCMALISILKSYFDRENMKNSKSVLMALWPRHRKFLRKDGSCKMAHHGQATIPGTILE